MAIDPAPLGQLAARFMEDLEAQYGPEAELVDAIIVVEVAHDGTTDEDLEPLKDGEGYSAIQGRVLSGKNTAGVGMSARILRALLDP